MAYISPFSNQTSNQNVVQSKSTQNKGYVSPFTSSVGNIKGQVQPSPFENLNNILNAQAKRAQQSTSKIQAIKTNPLEEFTHGISDVAQTIAEGANIVKDTLTPKISTINPIKEPVVKKVQQLPNGIKLSFTTPTLSDRSAQLVTPQEVLKTQENPVKEESTLKAAPAPSVWDKVMTFVNSVTGNTPTDEKARDMNAYAIQKIGGDKLYKERIDKIAGQLKISSDKLDKSIQSQAQTSGKSKYDLVGLSLKDLSKQGGNPFSNSLMEDVSKELGIRSTLTNNEFKDLMMALALPVSFAVGGELSLLPGALPGAKGISTITQLKALGKFTAVSTVFDTAFQKITGKQSVSELLPEGTPMPVKVAVDALEFLGKIYLTHGIDKVSGDIRELLTKRIIQKYGIPQSYVFSPKEVQNVVVGTNQGIAKDILSKAGLSSQEWKNAAQKGVKIDIPAENIMQLVDKPYWKKLKGLFGIGEAKPIVTSTKGHVAITNIAGLLPSGEMTPQEARKVILDTPLEGTNLGREILKATVEAENQGKNIVITNDVQIAEKTAAQNKIRIPETFSSDLEEKSLKTLHEDPIKLRDQYIKENDNEINPDVMRKMFEGYKGYNASEFSRASNALTDITYNHMLDARQGERNNTVLFTAGGPGSGKSSSINLLGDKADFPIILDTTFSYGSALRRVKQALNNGYDVKIRYVLRDPFEAWIEGVLPRVEKTGRIIDEAYHLDAHDKARKNVLFAYDKYKDNPNTDVTFFRNVAGKGLEKISVEEVRNFSYNKKETAAKMQAATEKAYEQRKLTKEQYEAITTTRPETKRVEGENGRIRQANGEELQRSSSQRTTPAGKLKPKYDYQSTQLNLPQDISHKIQEFAKKIPDSELSIDEADNRFGIEKEPHVTVLYGLDNNITEKQLQEVVKGTPPITIELSKTSVFDTNEGYDVLKIDVKSDTLEVLHKKIDDAFETPGKTFNDYKPHVTIAYLKKGNAQKYVGDTTFEGEKVTLNSLVFSQKSGGKIEIPLKREEILSPKTKSKSNSPYQASKGPTAIGSFEKVEPSQSEYQNFKLFEKVQGLIKKYARQIGEGYLPRGAAGVHFKDTQNIRVSGMNDLSVASHEIAHFLDQKNTITEAIGKRSDLGNEITDLYIKYYPGGRKEHKFEKRVVEGFATLLQKYVEMPRTVEAEYPNLVNKFLKPGGEFYRPVIGDIINDLRGIVSEYQGLSSLDKIGARVADKVLKTGKKDFLNFGEKIRTFIEDEIYPVEKVGMLSGEGWTVNDPSLWLRQYSRGGGIYANNILNKKTGYWSLNEDGDFVKKHDFNWKTLQDHLAKEKIDNSFNSYLIARDQYFNWLELDKLEKDYLKKKPILDLGKKFGIDIKTIENNSKIAEEMGVDVKELKKMISEAQAAEKEYKNQKRYLENNGFTRDEITSGYLENKARFEKEEKLHDLLVREDLNLLHNTQVQLVDKERYDQLKAKEGYASMKRVFYDELVGDEKAKLVGVSTTGANKASSLLRRSGGQQQIIPPVLNGMMNHIEIVKKAMKQIVYNKIGNIAEKATLPDIFQKVPLETHRESASGRTVYPQDKDPKIIMARKAYKRSPILADTLIRRTIDSTLTFQSMNIFEHLMVTAGRVFTIGTTGAYAPFSLVNFPADQWNAIINTRNKYTPLVDNIKILGRVMVNRKGKIAQYWQEWEIMGGDRMTLFQAQMGTPDDARRYVLQEKIGIQKILYLLDKGVDIASLPAKYSETVSRFTEYAKAREKGKAQVVALEEAGRVTAPFHHIGSWRFGDKASAKYVFRSIPFGNASLQVLSQTIRSAQTKGGRQRIFFATLALTALYLSSIGIVSQYGSKDQKEQYIGLRPQDISLYLHFPALGGGLFRVRVSQELSTIGTILSMISAQNLLGTQYTVEDYKDALTNWVPRQFNILSPVEAFISWLNPLIKIPIEIMANFKDYPRISPIENLSMLSKEPRYRYNEATSVLAKKIGDIFNLSPLKIDYLIQGIFGRATGYLTVKPRIYNPISQVQRDYYFTMDRRVEEFYKLQEKNNQQYNAVRPDKDGVVAKKVSKEELNQIYKTHVIVKAINEMMDVYRAIDIQKHPRQAEAVRDRIIDLLKKVDIK